MPVTRGDLAIIAYNTGQTDVNGSTVDELRFVALRPLAAGEVIFFTDRTWNGTAFVAGGSDGTITYTVPGGGVAAGDTVTLTMGGGFNPEEAGDAIYVYQGAINAPTTFLYALELGDNNNTFNGSLAGTGLTNGVDAVAVSFDSASYHGPTHDAYAHLYNGEQLLENISDFTNWVGDDATAGGTPKALNQPDHNGPYNRAPDFSLWSAAGGGGGGIVHVGGDATVGSGAAGFNLTHLYTGLLNGGITQFWGPKDLTFDTVHGRFFLIDSDGTGGHNRIFQGNISDLLGNPTAIPTLTTLYNDPSNTLLSLITNIEVDPQNGIVYFTQGQEFKKVVVNTANQTPTVLANFGTGSGNPNGTTNNTFDDFVINFSNGNVYLSSHRIVSAADGDQVTRNYVYRIAGLDPGDSANAFTFGNGLITVLPFSPDDDDANNGINFAAGEGFPQEVGTVEGLALSGDGTTLYIAAAKTLYDNDGDGGVIGGPGTDPILTPGGIYAYALSGNPTGTFTNIYVPIDDGNDGSAAINTANGPQGLLDDLEIDAVTGHLYFVDLTGDQLSPSSNPPGDEGVWRIDLDGTPNAAFFQGINNIDSLSASSLFLNRAPTVTSSTQATPGVTEASSAPGSGLTALVQPFLSLDVSDFETADQTDQLAGATVWVSTNFLAGATHQDRLTINGTTSGTLDFGAQDITYNYNSATGAMTLTGTSTFNNYESAIALVRFNTSGDNPTDFGYKTSRTISWAVSDGLNHSEAVSTTVSVTGINDAPVNAGMTGTFSGAGFFEDNGGGAALTGITVSDVDADPAAQNLVFTFSVAHGSLTFLTNVTGGIVAGDITGGANGSGTVTITATQNEINATLGAANGLMYIPTANFNGNDTLTLTTNDQGFNGNDPGNSGTGTTEADTDNKTIFVSAVNDAPTVAGDGTEAAADIFEDIPSAAGQTVTALFNGQFSDATDDQSAFGGSSANTLAGIAIITSGSSASGEWQYFNGSIWVNIGAASLASAQLITAGTAIRFNPALNFNGVAPTLTAHLVETGGAAFNNLDDVNLSGVGATGGITRYSTGTVVLSQNVIPVNDPPTQTNLFGVTATWTEGAASPTLLDVGSNATLADVDSANFDGGTLTVAITGGLVAAEDQLVIQTVGTVTFTANTVSVGGTQIATYVGGGAGGGNLVFTFDADATPATVAELIRAISYTNSGGDDPTDGNRTITWTLVDGDGVLNGGVDTLSGTTTLDVDPVNDPPSGADATIGMNEDGTHILTAANFGFTDPLDGDNFSAVVLTTLPANGDLYLNNVAITVAGTVISIGDITGNLLTFKPDANQNGAGYTTFTFQVRDDGGTLDGGQNTDQSANTITFDVTALNDAPLHTVPGGQTINEGGTLTFNAANLNLISVADVDAGAADLTTTVTVADGALVVGAVMAGLSVTGENTNSLTLVGTLAEINDALDGLSYTPPANANGGRTITVTTDDGGATGTDPGLTGTGGSEEDSDPIAVTINSVNDEPAGADATFLMSEDGTYTLVAASFGFTDPIDGDSLAAVVLTTLPANGDLYLNNVAITVAGTVISATDINNNLLTFKPDADQVGVGYASFTFQVRDSGGTLNGGVNTDQSANTITFDVTAVNDAPVSTVGATVNINEDATNVVLSTDTSPMSVSDVDAGSGDISYTLSVQNGALTILTNVAGGITGADIVAGANGSDTIVILATQAEINTTLAAANSLLYTPVSQYNGTDTLNVYVNDLGQTGADPNPVSILDPFVDPDPGPISEEDNDDRTINIASVNDAPSGADKTVTVSEDDTYTFTVADFGFTDPADGDGFASVFVNGVPAQGDLLLNGIQVVSGQTITTVDIGNNLLTFTPDPNTFGTAYGEFSFQVQDDGGILNGGSNFDPSSNKITIDVTPDNLPPLLSVTDTLAYTENDAATVIAPASTLTDSDSPDFDTGSLEVSLGVTATAADQLGIRDEGAGAGQIGVAGTDVSYGGTVIGGFSGGANGADLVVTLDADATPAAVEALLRNVTYANSSDNPVVTPRTVTFTVDDGDGNQVSDTATINLTAQDDPADARDDGVTTDEATPIFGGDLFADNGNGADTDVDGPGLSVASVNGASGAVNNTITLASGASLKVNDDGTFDYNSNGVFNRTPTALSGASNTPALDGFQYTLTNGDTATVTVVILGLDSNDLLLDTPGIDTLDGGGGNDDYVVTTLGDSVTEAAASGFDRVFSSVNHVLAAGSEVEVLATINNLATTAINLTGNELNNYLVGNAGANTLDGGAGADYLDGRGGNDRYFVDNVADFTIESVGGGGYDIVFASVSYILAAGQEIEVLGTINNLATTALNLTGNELDNYLVGNEGANVLNGGLGRDYLDGRGGDDSYFVEDGDVVLEANGGGYDIVYASQSHILAGIQEVEVLATIDNLATTSIDLSGNAVGNLIVGNAGNNVIDGGGGRDYLDGRGGTDTFAFTTALGGSNVDTILGTFTSGDDKFLIDNAVFAGLPTGALAASAFVVDPVALDADDRIVYDSVLGTLYFDADGSGSGAATVLFATVDPGTVLAASDFTVI